MDVLVLGGEVVQAGVAEVLAEVCVMIMLGVVMSQSTAALLVRGRCVDLDAEQAAENEAEDYQAEREIGRHLGAKGFDDVRSFSAQFRVVPEQRGTNVARTEKSFANSDNFFFSDDD